VTFETFRGARQAEGHQPRSRRAPTGSDQSYADRRPSDTPLPIDGHDTPLGPLSNEKILTLKRRENVFSTFKVLLKNLKKIHTV